MKKGVIIIGGVIVVIIAIACGILMFGESNVKIGFMGNSTSQSMKATFQYFDGKEYKNIGLKEGEKLNVNYELTVLKGELKVSILDANNDVVETRTGGNGEIEIIARSSQKYKIELEGIKAKGDYKVDWNNN